MRPHPQAKRHCGYRDLATRFLHGSHFIDGNSCLECVRLKRADSPLTRCAATANCNECNEPCPYCKASCIIENPTEEEIKNSLSMPDVVTEKEDIMHFFKI